MAGYENCLDKINSVMRYGVDIDGSAMRAEEFYGSLYVRRAESDEGKLRRFLDSAETGVLVIEGIRGCGKTSFMRHGLAATDLNDTLPYLIDCDRRTLDLQKAAALRDVDAIEFIHYRLKRRFMNDMIKDGHMSLTALCAEIIRSADPLLEYALWGEAAAIETVSRNGTCALESLLAADPAILKSAIECILKETTLADMIRAAMNIRGQHRGLLVADNIDRLPLELQALVYRLVHDVYLAAEGALSVVASIRSRNHRSVMHPGGSKIPASRIALQMTDSADNEFTREVFERRLNYVSTSVMKDRDSCTGEFQECYEAIEEIAKDIFAEEGLSRLANGSYTDVLSLKYEFAVHLLELVERGIITWREESGELCLTPFDCRSHLYRWMYNLMNARQEWLINPVQRYRDYSRNRGGDAIDCDLHTVILAWLCSSRRKRQGATRIREMIDDFSQIGVGRRRLLLTLFELYQTGNARWRYVDLSEGERNIEMKQIRPHMLVQATPLGWQYVHDTMTKFEFLTAALEGNAPAEEGTSDCGGGITAEPNLLLPKLTEYFELMSKAHSTAIHRFRGEYRVRDGWDTFYRDRFCIGNQLAIERMMRSHLKHIRARYPDHLPSFQGEYERLLRTFYTQAELRRDAASTLKLSPGGESGAGGRQEK